MLTAIRKPANHLSWLNADVSTLKQRLERIMKEKGWEHGDLVRESGQSHSVVSQWLGKGSKEIKSIGKAEAAERLSAATGYRAVWIAKGTGPERGAGAHRRDYVIADMVKHSATLRDVARMQVRSRVDLTPEQAAEYLAALDALEDGAQH